MKDVGHLKGSTVHKSPDVIQDHKIEIPQELVHQCDDLILFIDLFDVNGLPMLTSIDSPIQNCNHCLPYKAIPKVMLIALVKLSTRQLIFYPAKNDVSPYYSPYMLLNKRNFQYNKHCAYTFGSYIQATEEN